MVKQDDAPIGVIGLDFIFYKKWFIVNLDALLEMTKEEFWFEKIDS
jgi:hypothetical protein